MIFWWYHDFGVSEHYARARKCHAIECARARVLPLCCTPPISSLNQITWIDHWYLHHFLCLWIFLWIFLFWMLSRRCWICIKEHRIEELSVQSSPSPLFLSCVSQVQSKDDLSNYWKGTQAETWNWRGSWRCSIWTWRYPEARKGSANERLEFRLYQTNCYFEQVSI